MSFFQLRNQMGVQSDYFGCELVPASGADYWVQNPLIPLPPGTLNSVLTPSVIWGADGNLLSPDDYNDWYHFVDATDYYDREWDGSGWVAYWDGTPPQPLSGDQIPFGYGDSVWLNQGWGWDGLATYDGFGGCTIGFFGFLPPQ
jgi:hypothetical protein